MSDDDDGSTRARRTTGVGLRREAKLLVGNQRLRFAVLVAAALAAVGCGDGNVEWQAPEIVAGCLGEGCTGEVVRRELCEVVVCLAGGGGDLSYGNEVLTEVCERLPGVVRRCDNGGCSPLFDDASAALVALEEVTTRVAQGSFHRRDDGSAEPTTGAESCRISLLGYSWGALNAVDLAALVVESEEIPAGLRRVDRAVLIDAYSPFAGAFVDVPDGVGQAWSYRHSVPQADDCSSKMPLGPYVGLPIRCTAEMRCDDYDLSLRDVTIGHCSILSNAEACVTENVVYGRGCSTPPPAVPVLTR